MKYVKALLKALKSLGLPVHPGIIALIVLAIGLLILWWRSRAKKKEEAKADAPAGVDAAATAAPVQKVPKDRFTQIWKRFTEDLPSVVRRSLPGFAPFVVMSTDRASAARLINTHTDWERQARSLFGSHVDDPDLKIYLGSKVLVLDMPESVLNETSSSARKALLNLWKPLFRRLTPTVVAVVSPTRLASLRPEQIGDLADAIRGKVNLLSWVRKKPIEIRIALTDLDQVRGFSGLATLAESHHIPLDLAINEGTSDYELEGQLNERLAELYQFVELGLTDLPADRFSAEFTELVAFFRDAPAKLSPHIATFLAALMVRQPLGEQPILRRVYLTTPEGATTSNPFDTPTRPDKIRSPLFWHAMAAGIGAFVLVAGLAVGYFYEQSLWEPAHRALTTYLEQNPETLRSQKTKEAQLRTDISRFANRTAFPGFFAATQKQMQDRLRTRILQVHIEHRLEDALEARGSIRQAIYLLALGYAASENSLGQFTADREMVRHWARATGLSEDVILDYVISAKKPDVSTLSESLNVSRITDDRKRWTNENFEDWLRFFGEVDRLVTDGNLTRVDVTHLKDQAGPLIGQLARVETYHHVPRMVQLLTNIDPDLATLKQVLKDDLLELQDPETFQSSDKRKEIGRFMGRVVKTNLVDVPDHGRLGELCQWLERTLDPKTGAPASEDLGILALFMARDDSPEDRVEFQVEDYQIRESDWVRLTRDNTIREALRRFRNRSRGASYDLFFTSGDQFQALELNPETKGKFLFTGKARIPGKYTTAAIRERILPPLECLGSVWPRLTRIAPTEAGELAQGIEGELRNYATLYSRAMGRYYEAYGLDAGQSITRLKSILDRMSRASSPFTRHLLDIANNSRVPIHGAFAQRYLEPLKAQMETYRVIREVATSTATADTPLGAYLEFAGQIQEALQIDPMTDVPKSEVPAAEAAQAEATLESRLSPAGRMALQMLQCGPDSALTRIEGWLEDVQMPKAMRGPFLALPRQVYLVGRKNIEVVTNQIWQRDVLGGVRDVSQGFPFSPRRGQDATPEQLTELFHPITGRITLIRQAYLDPVYKPNADGKCRFRYASEPPLPPRGSTLLNKKIQSLTTQLWNEKGEPRPMMVTVTPVAFKSRLTFEQEGGQNSNADPTPLEELLTLTFLSSGATTIVNFNQRPFSSELAIDWTRPHVAQVGIRLTHPETRAEVVPERIAEESHWALLRLLVPPRARRAGNQYTWEVPFTRKSGSRRRLVRAEVTFEIAGDPFEAFQFTELLDMHAELGRRARSGR